MRKTAPDNYRFTRRGDPYSTTPEDGMNGDFTIPLHRIISTGHKVFANCIVSDGKNKDGSVLFPWEHVSVHVVEYGKMRTPTWDEMCAVKDIFWDDDEAVVQYHPEKKNYVNVHPHVLHLWKPTAAALPTPPAICV
jgi:hypothetical protein